MPGFSSQPVPFCGRGTRPPAIGLFQTLGRALLACAVSRLDAAVYNIANGDVPGLKNAIIAANTNTESDTINLAGEP